MSVDPVKMAALARRACATLALVAGAAGAAPNDDQVARLRTLRLILPETAETETGAARLRAVVEKALGPGGGYELAVEDPRSEAGRDYVPVRLTGRAADVSGLVEAIAGDVRLMEIESLELEPEPSLDRLSFKMRVRLRYGFAAHESSLDQVARPIGDERASWLGYVRSLLVTFGASRSHDVRWYGASYQADVRGARARLRGVFRWPTDAASVRGWLEERFGLSAFETRELGLCTGFEVEAPVRWQEGEKAADPEIGSQFGLADGECRSRRDEGRLGAVRARGTGSLTLRLLDVDVADVICLLGRQTGQTLLVDGDVTGRLDTDLRGVTLDEAFTALGRVGIAVSPPGPIRRFGFAARGTPPAPPLAPAGLGESLAISLDFKRGSLEDIVRLLPDIGGGRVLAPRLAGSVSIVARDRPWPDLYAAMLATVGLSMSGEGDTIRILGGDAPAALPQKWSAVFMGGAPSLSLRLTEFQLAGIVSTDDGWMALGRDPVGRLLQFPAGTRLADAQVLEVGPEDALLGGRDESGAFGAVRFNLPLDEPPSVTLSRATTRILAPLTKSGLPDYGAYLNARYGASLSPATNAWSLMGDVFESAGAGPRLRGWNDTADFVAQRAIAWRGPWTEKECPLVADWLRQNEAALGVVTEAARRPGYWRPLGEGEPRTAWTGPNLSGYRIAVNALVARSFRSLGRGESRRAVEDLVSASRLGPLVMQGPTIVEVLVGNGVRDIALGAWPRVASELDRQTAARALSELRRLPRPRPFVETLDGMSRYLELDLVLAQMQIGITRGPAAWRSWIDPFGQQSRSPLFAMPVTAYDWDELLRLVNHSHDVDAAALRAATTTEGRRLEATAAKDLEQFTERAKAALEERMAATPSADSFLEALVRDRSTSPEERLEWARFLFLGTDLGGSFARAQLGLNEGAARQRLAEAVLTRIAEPSALGRLAGRRDGYLFAIRAFADGTAVTAMPEEKGRTGNRWFCVDSRGASVSSNEGEPLVAEMGCVAR